MIKKVPKGTVLFGTFFVLFSIKSFAESLGKRKFAGEIFQGGVKFPDRRYSPRAERLNR